MPLPTCSPGCDNTLPVFLFDDCSPELNAGNITWLYTTNRGNPLTDWTDEAEWAARIDNDSTDSAAIRRIRVIGSKPAPDKPETVISGDRTYYGKASHVIDFRADETNAINHEALRQMECGQDILLWYETIGGLRWGGNEGIEASIKLDEVIPESSSEFINFVGQAKWKAKFTPERIDVALIS
jgi:hypothetical protein